jgi:hypothetical protein
MPFFLLSGVHLIILISIWQKQKKGWEWEFTSLRHFTYIPVYICMDGCNSWERVSGVIAVRVCACVCLMC